MSDRLEVEESERWHTVVPDSGDRTKVVSDLLRHADLPLNTRCGGRGLCDGCLIQLSAGGLVNAASGERVEANGAPVTLRGCEHRLDGPASIRIPRRSSLRYGPQVVTDFRVNITGSHDPLVQEIELDAPSTTPEALCDAILKARPGSPVKLDPKADVASRFVRVEIRPDHRLITKTSPHRSERLLGAAIDIGTTTVAVLLMDLRTGQPLGRASAFNEQMRLGDDVVTRISLCTDSPAMLRQLQDAVAVETIAPLIRQVLAEAGASAADLACVVSAGNTTMQHLLAGVDPTPMGTAPFTPAFVEHRVLDATIIDPSLAGVPLHLLPSAAAYVGADLVAGAIASGLAYDPGPSLLVDVGTNGEILLVRDGIIYGCATAAGPAFEGARLACGMRAGEGAVSHVSITAEPPGIDVEVIGGAKRPSGICGSAYVDVLFEAHSAGLLSDTGRIRIDDLPRGLAKHVGQLAGGDRGLILATGLGNQPVGVSEPDIASLLQAKAAIAAGILTLLERLDQSPADVKTVYVAGGFGTHLRRESAIGCGMLPGFDIEQLQPVGNTSLAGAMLALLDAGLTAEMARIGQSMEVIELNLDPGFEMRYIEQLSLAPEP